MSKRTPEDAGEERVTAKSRPMKNLIARSSERTPLALSSTASESPGKTRYESQTPLSSQDERYKRKGRPVVCSQRSSQPRFFCDSKNFNLEKDESHKRTERPVVCSERAHQFVIEDDEAESELSSGSRSFLHRVNDQVRKRQKQSSKDAIQDSDKHSVIWRTFMSSTMQASFFMVKDYLENLHSIKNTEDLTMKQMFKISENLISEQSDEIYGVKTTNLENSSWKYLSLIGDEEVINLQHIKVYIFFDSVFCLGKINEYPQSNIAWEDRLTWFKSSPAYRTLDRIDGEPMEFEWTIFTGFTTLHLCHKVQELLLRLSVTPENFTGRIIFMSMFNDISWRSKDDKREYEANAQIVSLYAKKFGAGQWSFLGPGSQKKWYSISEDSPQGEWDKTAELMMLKFGESGHPVFRAPSPLSRAVLKSKGGGKLSIHYCADHETIETVFRTIISVNQLSIYGAVAEMCEEYESYHNRPGRPVVGGGSDSSFVPSVIKTNIPLTDDPAQPEEDLLQRFGERIEKLSQQDRVSKFCTDAGFLTTVEVGQYFMTTDTE